MSVANDPRPITSRVRPYLGDGSSLLIGLQVAMSVLRLGSNLILTRLLAPEAFGVVGIITSISYVLVMVSDLGLRSFVIRHPNISDELIQTAWTLRFLRNVVLAGVMFVGADFFAGFYSVPEIGPAVRIVSGLFLIDATGALSFLTAERERRVVRVTIIDFAKFLFVTGSTIIAAYFLRNYWAIVASMFLGSIYSVVTSYTLVSGPPVRFRLDREHVLDLWRFSRVIIPASIISIFLTQTDKFFLAKYFPLAELGKFMLATGLAATIMTMITRYIMRVFYPRFAHLDRQDPDKAGDAYYELRRPITLLIAFGIGGVIGGAELLIRVLFNDLYLGAGFYLSILCLRPLAKLSSLPATNAIITRGFVRVSLHSNILRLVWVIAAGTTAFFYLGPLAVIVVMSLTDVVLLPYFWLHARREGLVKFSEELFIFGVAAAGFLIGYTVDTVVHRLIEAGQLPSF